MAVCFLKLHCSLEFKYCEADEANAANAEDSHMLDYALLCRAGMLGNCLENDPDDKVSTSIPQKGAMN